MKNYESFPRRGNELLPVLRMHGPATAPPRSCSFGQPIGAGFAGFDTVLKSRDVLETCHLGEVETLDAHRRSYHVERLFATGPHRPSQVQHLAEHREHALVEAQVANSLACAPVLHQKCSVSR